ncbi:hypothetical protein BLNAU_20554 [Blattamonas nauphoetae]|uniref:Uncharacterized protein n=1 Tax=Blattamonas nauphoetae TaxID=2049346 RepID=A0ABQ9WXW3_9EUKA|nr:hypothetical protein BLNAU_20708 [Blattamonas nauphoetae]KAK2944548.1 hypothetical protein BLNAU_20554 [Blattamonas nauphoetae]
MGVVLVKDDILRLVRAQFGTIGSQIRTAVVSSGSQYSKTSVEQMNELDPIVLGGDGLTATTCSQLSEVSIYSDSGSTADSRTNSEPTLRIPSSVVNPSADSIVVVVVEDAFFEISSVNIELEPNDSLTDRIETCFGKEQRPNNTGVV